MWVKAPVRQDNDILGAILGGEAEASMAETSLPDAVDRAANKKTLSPEAQRALAEAEARRQMPADPSRKPVEVGGRSGPDPVRFGDWEKAGLASDF